MKIRPLQLGYVFPLTLFAFMAVSVTYINILFNTTTRWAALALLLIFVFFKGRLNLKGAGLAGVALGLYLFWCILTGLWSEVPTLSYMKGGAFALTAITLVCGGMYWARTRPPHEVLWACMPITFLAIAAGGLGYNDPNARFAVQSVNVYQGLTGNSNMLGLLAAAGMIFALWWYYDSTARRLKGLKKFLPIGLLLILLMMVFSTVSRSSILMLSCIGMFYLAATGKARWAIYLFFLVLAASLFVILFPDVIDRFIGTYVFKGNRDSASFSRNEVWDESLRLAKAGGWFGGGYGVTIGQDNFSVGLTSLGYGREQGNTQLAIMEQTGIVGIALYLLFVVLLVIRLLLAFLRNPIPEQKAVLGILTGGVVGMLVHSCFEAWWVAPGSPEAPYFWGLVGMGLGCARAYSPKGALRMRFRRRPVAYAMGPRPVPLQPRNARSGPLPGE